MLKKTNVDTIFNTQHIEISKFHFISTHIIWAYMLTIQKHNK